MRTECFRTNLNSARFRIIRANAPLVSARAVLMREGLFLPLSLSRSGFLEEGFPRNSIRRKVVDVASVLRRPCNFSPTFVFCF